MHLVSSVRQIVDANKCDDVLKAYDYFYGDLVPVYYSSSSRIYSQGSLTDTFQHYHCCV